MSVWKKVQSKVLYENVDKGILKEALSEMNVTLDETIKEVNNAYGRSKVDAGLIYNNKTTALGIVFNQKNGISLVGDTWQSGIVGDKQADKLINMISQMYQKVKLKKELELQGWNVEVIKRQDKVVLECTYF